MRAAHVHAAGVRRVLAWAALAVGLPGVIAACGQQHAGVGAAAPSAPASASPAPSVTPASGASSPATAAGSGGCAGATPVSAVHGTLTLGGSDNGTSLCVRNGTVVLVFLHGTAASRWTPIRVSSADLVPHPDTSFMLALGVTGGSFIAVHPGTVSITSTRGACGPVPEPAPTGPTTSTSKHCQSDVLFRVTLVITR